MTLCVWMAVTVPRDIIRVVEWESDRGSAGPLHVQTLLLVCTFVDQLNATNVAREGRRGAVGVGISTRLRFYPPGQDANPQNEHNPKAAVQMCILV